MDTPSKVTPSSLIYAITSAISPRTRHTPESLFRQRFASKITDYRIGLVTLFLYDPRSVGIPVVVLESGTQLTSE